ncbi:UNVERIFIED_CONTAM: Retrovirus-related Pol polyprotein from transposon opus [Sesamum indicum]
MFGVERNRIIEEKVDKLLQAEFVREIQYTTWLSNVVIVPKAAGKWRMCTDFTNLNKACPKDPYLLPRLDLLVDSTAVCALFAMMDAYQGYHQIFMAKEDAKKTAFVTEKGVYCYNVMSFGLKNAGATYQRLVNRMFKDHIGSTMEVYVDDMLVKSKQECDHLLHLRTTFSIMRSYGMRLNPSKCTFRLRSSKSIKEVQQLTGKVASLNRLIAVRAGSSGAKIVFDYPPLLSNPMIGEKLYVYLAVSDNAVSSVLVREENGKQSPKKYIQIEKLVLALVTTTRKLRPYFQSHPIVVLTNHPLKQVMSRPDTSGRMVKWAVELGEFDIEFQTRSAVKPQEKRRDGCYMWMGRRPQRMGEPVFTCRVRMVQGTYETREWSMTQYLVKVKEMMKKIDRCTINQIPRDENARPDALSKFGSLVEGVKERKITVMVKSQPVIDEKVVHAVEVTDSWKTPFVRYLKQGELPSDAIAAKRI